MAQLLQRKKKLGRRKENLLDLDVNLVKCRPAARLVAYSQVVPHMEWFVVQMVVVKMDMVVLSFGRHADLPLALWIQSSHVLSASTYGLTSTR